MPSFKPKTNKKIKFNKQKSITLDGKHKEFLNEFSKNENDKIPDLKAEKKELELKLANPVLTIEQKLDIADRIKEITSTIKELKSKKKEYFLDNSKFIFDYFENKKNISTGASSELSNKNKLLNNFFKIKQDDTLNTLNQTKNNNIVQKYLCNIDDVFLDVNSFVCQTDICQYCYKGELIPLEDEGILICNNCSRNVPYLIENEKPSYKEPPKRSKSLRAQRIDLDRSIGA